MRKWTLRLLQLLSSIAMTMAYEGNRGADANYFVCTLGQAALINAKHPHQFSNINDFLDCQAHATPDAPAVGFPIPSKVRDVGSQWKQKIISMSAIIEL